MKLKTVLTIKAIVCLSLGTIILLIPEVLYSLFGVSLEPGGVFAAREYGAALIGTLLITWFSRNEASSNALRAIVLGLFIYDGIGFVLSVAGVISGLLNPLGWLIVVLYLFFTIGFGYFYFLPARHELSVGAA
jgi:hypothetical protein